MSQDGSDMKIVNSMAGSHDTLAGELGCVHFGIVFIASFYNLFISPKKEHQY